MSLPDQTSDTPHDQGDDWKGLKLSLERPYQDDKGERIRPLLDIENDKFIYEESVSPLVLFQSLLRYRLQKTIAG